MNTLYVLISSPACVTCGVTCLVYTSTYNVVFGGQEIRNGDQSIPYLPLDKVRMVLFVRDILPICETQASP